MAAGNLVLVETKRGSFLAFENDRTIGRSLIDLGEMCEDQAEFFESFLKPGAVVLDVGANIGVHTAVFARIASIVYAFEPQRRVFNVLCGNMALNGLDNVECYRVAGGDKRGRIQIPSFDFEKGGTPGSFSMDTPGDKTDFVDVVPINIPCDFMKIDVEGWETKVLNGSRPMIEKCRPVLYVESDREDRHNELLRTIWSLGYKAYWHMTGLFRKNNYKGVEEHYLSGIVSQDMLCLPKEIGFDLLSEAKVR